MTKHELPAFHDMAYSRETALMISSDMHLTNTAATQEYDASDVNGWLEHCWSKDIIQILAGDTLDIMAVFFDVSRVYMPKIKKAIVMLGNHDDQWDKLPAAYNSTATQFLAPCPQVGLHFKWGERDFFVTHGHDPWDEFWRKESIRRSLGRAVLQASTHSQKLIHPKVDDVVLRALHVLEKAVIPKGKRIGSEKYDEASHEIVKKYHLETSKHKPVCVFGHTHAPVCHDMPSVIHLNTGSWQRGYYEEDGYYIHSPYQGVVYLDPENYPKVRYGRWNRKQFIDLEVV